SSMRLKFQRVDWEYATVFRISYRTQTHAETVLLELTDGDITGRGEALGVSYHGETMESLLEQLSGVAPLLRSGITRAELQTLLPAGGARNALDCALWDIEAKRAGRRGWELAGMRSVRPVVTDYTLGLDAPEAMGRAAVAAKAYSVLKLKLNGDGDLDRVARVRLARPDAHIMVDANEAWNEQQLHEL